MNAKSSYQMMQADIYVDDKMVNRNNNLSNI